MKKFLTTLAVLSAVATPAFAQSFDPDSGTGNVLPFSNTATAAVAHNGMRAFASVPGSGSVGNSIAPSSTGGGSVGYNEMLRSY